MNWLEITGFAFGIAGVWLTLKENVLCFPIGLGNVLLSLFLFYQQKLYADAFQQIVYIVLLSYGWLSWLKKNGLNKELLVSVSNKRLLYMCFLAFAFCTVVLGTLLSKFTDATFPWLDSAATSLSFVAQWMIAKKKIENWLIWMLVNVMYISIYIYKDLWLYSLLFFIYLLLAISGYINWKKHLIKTGT